MRIFESAVSQIVDLHTIDTLGIKSIDLMEKAALAFSEAFMLRYFNLSKGIIVCGPGNNGGDGLAIARLLSDQFDITVFLFDGFETFSSDRIENQNRLPSKVKILKGTVEEFRKCIGSSQWVCDALFGAGLNRALEGDLAKLVLAMNDFPGLKVSVDLPTGLDNSISSKTVAFKADWVGTFHSPKLPFFFPSSQKFVSEFTVLDIGLIVPETGMPELYFLQKEDVIPFVKERKRFSHKGTYGHGLIIAGSEGKMGAAVLATKAMLRSGVGLATCFVPRSGLDVLQISVPEAMCIADPDKKNLTNLPPLGVFQSIGIGPGIGIDPLTAGVLKKVLERSIHPIVIDADALNILSEHKNWLEKICAGSILTPHPKEFERLVGKSKSDAEVFEKAKSFAVKHSVYLILKGAYSLICSPEGKGWFNSTGNPGMATGGSGDVLTGLLTGLLAQGYTPQESCLLGVFIHGLAGDLASEKLGQQAMVASDLILEFSNAFKLLQTSQDSFSSY